MKRKPEYEPGVITAQLLSSLYINNKIFRQANTGSHRFVLVQFAPIQNNADFETKSKSEKNIFYYYL